MNWDRQHDDLGHHENDGLVMGRTLDLGPRQCCEEDDDDDDGEYGCGDDCDCSGGIRSMMKLGRCFDSISAIQNTQRKNEWESRIQTFTSIRMSKRFQSLKWTENRMIRTAKFVFTMAKWMDVCCP